MRSSPRWPIERMQAIAQAVHVDSSGRGAQVALLHGWAMHAGVLAPLADALAAEFRVHAVDLPGHGHSARLRPWTVERAMQAIEARFADGDSPIDVVGWSLGALVALAWAHAHPRRVRRLVLIAATPKFVADAQWPHAMSADTLRRFADELRVAYQPTLQRFLALQVRGSDDGRATLAALRKKLFSRGAPDAALLHDALDALAATDLRDVAARVDVRTLVMAGDRDTLAPLEASRWLAATMPDARLCVIEGAAHAPFVSHPQPAQSAIASFLRDG